MKIKEKEIDAKNKTIFRGVSPKIIITSFPRSGNNWLCTLISRIMEESFQRNDISRLISGRNGHVIIDIQREEDLEKALKSEKWSGIVKSHHFEIQKDYRIIYIFRDAREVLASYREWFRYEKNNDKLDFEDKEFVNRNLAGVIRHWGKALLFKIKHPKNIYLISYSCLQNNPIKYLIGLTEFLGIKTREDELMLIISECNFDRMSRSSRNSIKNGVPFIRKGKADKGIGEFENQILIKILIKSCIPYYMLCIAKVFQKLKATP
jgi:hypothetical protein